MTFHINNKNKFKYEIYNLLIAIMLSINFILFNVMIELFKSNFLVKLINIYWSVIYIDSLIKKYHKINDLFKIYIKIFTFYLNSSFKIPPAAPSPIPIGKQ